MTAKPNDDPPPPQGVKLRDPEDSETLRKDLEESVIKSMGRYVNGFEYGGVRLELGNLRYADKEKYSIAEQHEALMADRMLARRIRGDVKLVDVATNQVLDSRKNFTLARMPYLTQRGTFINNGSEFAAVSQSRLLPGVYARKRENGMLESHINTRPGTGPSMRLSFEPETAQYRLKMGSSDLHAYSVFKDLGVTDEELERRWGPQVMEINRSKYTKDTLNKVYTKAVPKWQRDDTLPPEQKIQAVMDTLNRAQVAKSILRRNLPNLYDREKAAFWRSAGRAVDMANEMAKAASVAFDPDMTPAQVIDSWQALDFDMEHAVKQAGFDPDFSPEDLQESYDTVYNSRGPRLASMKAWPQHWLDDQDKMGWLEWYRNYSDGRRSDQDERQIARWKSFKSRHGSQFVNKPSPRRAFALKNWAIDPIKMLPEEKRAEVMDAMEAYKRKEYMKWFINRHDFGQDRVDALVTKARSRGAEITDERPDSGTLMTLALDGHITPEDLK